MWGRSIDYPRFHTINAAWLLSYVCGLWEHWTSTNQTIPISSHDYHLGELDENPLFPFLHDKHVRLISPLGPVVLRMITHLTEIGVASIKLDSLCDEHFGDLISLGDEARTLLKLGAQRAEELTPTQCVVREDKIYQSWISKVLNQHKLKKSCAEDWRYVCLRASLAKTIPIKSSGRSGDDHLKMVYCPVTIETSKGLWVARTLHSELDTSIQNRRDHHYGPSYCAEECEWSDLPDYFNSLSRRKRYKIPYKFDENVEELKYELLDLSAKSFRLPTKEELVAIGLAGDDDRIYSGADQAIHLYTKKDVYHESVVALHTANPWGVYDIGVIREYVWDMEAAEESLYEEFFNEYIRITGYNDTLTIREHVTDPEEIRWHRFYRVEHAFRAVLPA